MSSVTVTRYGGAPVEDPILRIVSRYQRPHAAARALAREFPPTIYRVSVNAPNDEEPTWTVTIHRRPSGDSYPVLSATSRFVAQYHLS